MWDFKVLSHPGSFKCHESTGAELLLLWIERVAVITTTQPGDVAHLKINILTQLLICCK